MAIHNEINFICHQGNNFELPCTTHDRFTEEATFQMIIFKTKCRAILLKRSNHNKL